MPAFVFHQEWPATRLELFSLSLDQPLRPKSEDPIKKCQKSFYNQLSLRLHINIVHQTIKLNSVRR